MSDSPPSTHTPIASAKRRIKHLRCTGIQPLIGLDTGTLQLVWKQRVVGGLRARDSADGVDQLPPTLGGVRVRGTKPRVVVALQGWCVWCFGARGGGAGGVSDDGAAASASLLARTAAARASSFSRQQCLYLRPEPQ